MKDAQNFLSPGKNIEIFLGVLYFFIHIVWFLPKPKLKLACFSFPREKCPCS